MSDVTLTNSAGVEVFRGTSSGGGGLPTGWTQDAADPANVNTHSAQIDFDGGGINNAFVDTGGANVTTGGGTVDAGEGGSVSGTSGTGDFTLDATDGAKFDDGAGSQSQVWATEVNLEGPTGALINIAPDQTSLIKARPKEDGVALLVQANEAPAACIDPTTVPLIAAARQPEVPATPLPQDIVDALVTLGIVTQAS